MNAHSLKCSWHRIQGQVPIFSYPCTSRATHLGSFQILECVSSNNYKQVRLHRAGHRPGDSVIQQVGRTGRPRGREGAARRARACTRKPDREAPAQRSQWKVVAPQREVVGQWQWPESLNWVFKRRSEWDQQVTDPWEAERLTGAIHLLSGGWRSSAGSCQWSSQLPEDGTKSPRLPL